MPPNGREIMTVPKANQRAVNNMLRTTMIGSM
jgi:hypothetical protein